MKQENALRPLWPLSDPRQEHPDMNTSPRQHPATPGPTARARDPRDFIAVDDSGDFSYHRSERDLLTTFEYVAEAACIFDRSGCTYRLALDPNHRLILAPPLGPVEFHWLRQAWLDAQNAHPEAHRLRRFFPLNREEVLAALFETLTLEHGQEPIEGAWSLEINGIASHPTTLEDVDRQLAHQNLSKHVLVKDPFGHTYRPLRHRRHWYLPGTVGSNLYIEIPAPAPSR
jgi:hypothetical protein